MLCLLHPTRDSDWDTEHLSNWLTTQNCLSPSWTKKVSPNSTSWNMNILIYSKEHWGLESEGDIAQGPVELMGTKTYLSPPTSCNPGNSFQSASVTFPEFQRADSSSC